MIITVSATTVIITPITGLQYLRKDRVIIITATNDLRMTVTITGMMKGFIIVDGKWNNITGAGTGMEEEMTGEGIMTADTGFMEEDRR